LGRVLGRGGAATFAAREATACELQGEENNGHSGDGSRCDGRYLDDQILGPCTHSQREDEYCLHIIEQSTKESMKDFKKELACHSFHCKENAVDAGQVVQRI
jgi:hypothetical protein